MSCDCFSGNSVSAFLSFRKWIAPIVIHILFWVGSIAVVCGGLNVLIDKAFVPGLALIVLGPVAVRFVAEILMIPFVLMEKIETMGTAQALAPKK